MKKYYIQIGVVSIIVIVALVYGFNQTSLSIRQETENMNNLKKSMLTPIPQEAKGLTVLPTIPPPMIVSVTPSITINTPLVTPTTTPTKNLRIAGGLKDETDFFSGVIDDVRFYNKALSETEVLALYKELNPETKPDLQKGLIGWWKLDDNATDSTLNRNDGSITGATLTANRQGQPNKSYLFNGKDNYINIENSTPYNDVSAVTLTAWVKSALFSNDLHQLVIGRINNTGYRATRYDFGMGIGMGTRDRLDCFFGGAEWVASITNPIDNKWHMLTCTYDGTTTHVYVDGKLETTKTK